MDEMTIVFFICAGACIVDGSPVAALALIGTGVLTWFWGTR